MRPRRGSVRIASVDEDGDGANNNGSGGKVERRRSALSALVDARRYSFRDRRSPESAVFATLLRCRLGSTSQVSEMAVSLQFDRCWQSFDVQFG
uniref:Uncharacterized protein n=1 Tax=Plectus sambesii TaxID=2011161 RepID=A0A914URF6_9BILA